MSNYEYPNNTFSFGTTKAGTDNLRRERDEEKAEEIKSELRHEDKINKR